MTTVYSFDFDGVMTKSKISELADKLLREGKNVVVTTGRCIDESNVVYGYLSELELFSPIPIYFNTITFNIRKNDENSRHISGSHKRRIIDSFVSKGIKVIHFEDDPIQIDKIKVGNQEVSVIDFSDSVLSDLDALETQISVVHVLNEDESFNV